MAEGILCFNSTQLDTCGNDKVEVNIVLRERERERENVYIRIRVLCVIFQSENFKGEICVDRATLKQRERKRNLLQGY